jgi:hypothetical protein
MLGKKYHNRHNILGSPKESNNTTKGQNWFHSLRFIVVKNRCNEVCTGGLKRRVETRRCVADGWGQNFCPRGTDLFRLASNHNG